VCIVVLKDDDDGGIKFTNFSENQLTTVSRVRLSFFFGGGASHDLEGPVSRRPHRGTASDFASLLFEHFPRA